MSNTPKAQVAQHTPGPYHLEGCAIMAGTVQVGLALHGSFGKNPCPLSVSEVKANGDLFAAAPELLAALQGVMQCGDSIRHDSIIWKQIRQALAKATGEQ